MIYLVFLLLVVGAVAFSRYESRGWGTAKTPFAFIVYPFLAVLAMAVFVAPHLGFLPLHVRTLLVFGVYFALLAASSAAYRYWSTARGASPEPLGGDSGGATSEGGLGSLEYAVVCLLLVALFAGTLLGGGAGPALEKGELSVGGVKGRVMQVGVAYLVIALSQQGGALAARTVLAGLVLWILAANQVKYLILIPLAGSALYRWASGRLATWKLAVIGVVVPLTVVVVVYGIMGSSGVTLDPDSTLLFLEFAFEHTLGYVLSGVLGFDQLLARIPIRWLDLDGVGYVFSPFVNMGNLFTSSLVYHNPVNPVYFDIHENGSMDSNVFTLFGSLAYRGGWALASIVSLAFGAVTYWAWDRHWVKGSALMAAAGTYWIATAMLSWFDPYFPTLSTFEIVGFLWLRAGLQTEWNASRSRSASLSASPRSTT
jgi:hypothetical protein